MDDVIPSQSLPTVIIVGTAAATGLIILLICNIFVCGCIVTMCVRKRRSRRQPMYEGCTPTIITPSTTVAPLVRIQYDEDADYSEIAPRVDDSRIVDMRANYNMNRQHLATSGWGAQNGSYFAMSQPQLSPRWEAQRVRVAATSFDNIYSSVVDSQEDLTEQPQQMPLYRELEPMTREYSSEQHLSLCEHLSIQPSPISQSVDMTFV